jgi:hypothetical protein
MIMSVSTLIMSNGAATPSKVVNFCIVTVSGSDRFSAEHAAEEARFAGAVPRVRHNGR